MDVAIKPHYDIIMPGTCRTYLLILGRPLFISIVYSLSFTRKDFFHGNNTRYFTTQSIAILFEWGSQQPSSLYILKLKM